MNAPHQPMQPGAQRLDAGDAGPDQGFPADWHPSGDAGSFLDRHYRWAWVLVIASIASVLLIAWSQWQQSHDLAQHKFDRRVRQITTAIQERIGAYEIVLRSGRGLLVGSENVTRREWRDFVASLALKRLYPGIQGVGYGARLRSDQLAANIAAARADGFPDYAVFPPGDRSEYVVDTYLEPLDERNLKSLGYDMWSSPVRRAGLERARDTGETTISGEVTLVQEIDSDVQSGFLMFLPYYGHRRPAPTIAARRAALEGYVYAVFRVGDLMKGIVGGIDDLRLTLRDGSAGQARAPMYDSRPAGGAGGDFHPRFAAEVSLPIRGASWELRFESLPAFERQNPEYAEPVIVLIAGLITCAMLGFAVWSWGATRTRATAMADAMVTSLTQQRAELLRSNKELERFAYVASHDLRAPLRNINFLISWIFEDHEAELGSEVKERLGDVRICAGRMDALLNGILEYSRLGAHAGPAQLIEAAKLVSGAIALVGPPAGITVEIEGSLPDFHGAPARMKQVFVNLIDNAIKHHDRAEGRITVSGSVDGEACVFRVCDDGPGIAPEFHSHVFEMFKTLRPRDEVEGSGMGLAIVQKTIEGHGGRIQIESSAGKRGTCFVFSVMKDHRNE